MPAYWYILFHALLYLGGNEHWDGESNFLLNSSPSSASREIKSTFPQIKTAKIVLQKLRIRKKLAKCEDCHKVLQGSRFQYSFGGTEQDIAMKCDKCKKVEPQAAEFQKQAMDSGTDIAREETNHPTLHETSRICPNVESKNSGRDNNLHFKDLLQKYMKY